MTTQDAVAPGAAANENSPIDQDAMSLGDLAQAVVDRRIKPRVGSIRRLAEAVLAQPAAPAVEKKKKKKAAKGAKAVKAEPSKKKRKQAKIPGQKSA